MTVAIVTGGSSGIGLETVKCLIEAGCKVYELSRRDFQMEKVCHKGVDVTDEVAVTLAIREIYEAEKKIDLLINSAGYGVAGAVEFTELADAKRQLDVNFYGVVNVTKAVLPYMRKAGKGRIVNVSSVAAVAPLPFQTYYSAGKAAVNSYTCSLANEVKPYGISVTAVMPGDIKTGFTRARVKNIAGDEAYGGRITKSIAAMERDEENGMNPESVGKYICAVALKKHVKPLYAIGAGYKAIWVLCMILPSVFKNWLMGILYGQI